MTKKYRLVITTVRDLTEEEYREYKIWTPLQVNWRKLEEKGVEFFDQKADGETETVRTKLELSE